MNIEKMDRAKRLKEWAEMASQCRNSGKTVAAWCTENGITTKTYYYRLKRVCEAIPEDKPAGLPMARKSQCLPNLHRVNERRKEPPPSSFGSAVREYRRCVSQDHRGDKVSGSPDK